MASRKDAGPHEAWIAPDPFHGGFRVRVTRPMKYTLKRLGSELIEVNYKTIALITILGSGLVVLTGQQPTPPGVFTSAQAEAGRTAYERTCGKCHTPSLLGRKGDKDELPPLSSLPAHYQKFIGTRGFVPPLAGKTFIDRWGAKTAAGLIARFQETVGDPFFQFEDMNDETTVNITAYVLQVNGAKAGTQPLTRATDVMVSSITQTR